MHGFTQYDDARSDDTDTAQQAKVTLTTRSGRGAGRPSLLRMRPLVRDGSEALQTAERDARDRAAVAARLGAARHAAKPGLRRLSAEIEGGREVC